MRYIDALEKLYHYLFIRKEKLKFKTYTTGWHAMICPYCGRENSEPHFYIFIPTMDKPGKVMVKCFKPDCTGANKGRPITQEDFDSLGITDDEVINCILDNNKKLPQLPSIISLEKNMKPIMVTFRSTYDNRQYFYDRINIPLTEIISEEFKVIGDIKEFLKVNKNYLSPQAVITLDKCNHCIGFLTENNQCISLRSNKKDSSFKLICRLTEKEESEVYFINKIKDKNKPKNMVISDGIFDIINAATKYVILENTEYYATLSRDRFISTIQEKIKNGTFDKLIILEDNIKDKSTNRYIRDESFYKKYKKLSYAFKEIWVVYDMISKDLGDMREKHMPNKICLYKEK